MVLERGPEVLGFIVENFGGGEVVVIAFLALVILGPERIPEMARGAGRLINKVRTMSSDLTGEMSDVINDPSMQPIRELGEFATRPRQKLAEYALEAEAEERQRRSESASGTSASGTSASGTSGSGTSGSGTSGSDDPPPSPPDETVQDEPELVSDPNADRV